MGSNEQFIEKTVINSKILDLHFTHFCSSCPVRFIFKGSNPVIHVNLHKLYLFKKISHLYRDNASHVKHICEFYEYLAKLPFLTHLDLSGWSYLDKVPKNTLKVFSKKLSFFGLYGTRITDKFSDITILCEEITGLYLEKYLVSTVSRYYMYKEYMINIFKHIYNDIVIKSVEYSEDTSIELIALILDTVDYHIAILPLQLTSLYWRNLMINSTACIYYVLEEYMKTKINKRLVHRSFETSIAMLHKIGVDALTEVHGVSTIVLNICWICCYNLLSIYSVIQLDQTWSNVLVKFILGIIVKVCEEPDIMHSHVKIPKIITRLLYILWTSAR